MSFIKLNVGNFIPNHGTDISWNISAGLAFAYLPSGGIIYLYLQRSTTKINYPLQPYTVKTTPLAEHVPPPESGWDTIATFTMPNGSSLTDPAFTTYIDNTQPNPTFNYRLIGYYTRNAPTDTLFGQVNWVPGTVTQQTQGAPGAVDWSKSFSGTSNLSFTRTVLNPDGTIIVVGSFKGTINLGGSPLTANGTYNSLVIAKFDALGNHVWSASYGGAGDLSILGLDIDSTGNIFVCGQGTASINVGGSTWTTIGQYNAWIAQYSSLGAHVWSKSFQPPNDGVAPYVINGFQALKVDSDNSVIAVGQFKGTCDFGGGNIYTSRGVIASVVVRFANNGTYVSAKTFTCSNENAAYGVALDASGNIFMSGYFYDTINFASNDSVDKTITGNPTYKLAYITKFNSAGVCQWAFMRGGAPINYGQGNRPPITVACDANGDVVLAAGFYQNADLGGGIRQGNGVDTDSFIAKYRGTDGSWLWDAYSKLVDHGCFPANAKFDSAGNIFWIGFFYGNCTIGTTKLVSVLNSNDGFVAKYSSNGVFQWAKSFGSANDAPDGILGMTSTTPDGRPIVLISYGSAISTIARLFP